MTLLMYILIGVVIICLLGLIVGLILPKERVHTKQSVFDAPPQKVFELVTDNVNWQYRDDIKDLKIISVDGNKQVWDEYGKDGMIIRFTTREYIPYSFYSFDMESKIMKGYWTSEYKEVEKGKTLYTATEYLTLENPFVRLLNYLFFDIDKYMSNQQLCISRKLNRN